MIIAYYYVIQTNYLLNNTQLYTEYLYGIYLANNVATCAILIHTTKTKFSFNYHPACLGGSVG